MIEGTASWRRLGRKQALLPPHIDKSFGQGPQPVHRSGYHLQLALRECSVRCWGALNLIRSVAPSDQVY